MNGIAGKRCAVYTRTAAANAAKIGEQREAAETHIAAHGGVVLPKRYDDNGASGNRADRPALMRLLRDVAAGRIERVAVQRYDRLARSRTAFADLLERLRRHGVELVSVTEPFGPEPLTVAGSPPLDGKAGAQ